MQPGIDRSDLSKRLTILSLVCVALAFFFFFPLPARTVPMKCVNQQGVPISCSYGGLTWVFESASYRVFGVGGVLWGRLANYTMVL